MSGSVFHIILLLSYHLHFGFNSQNQEIISKPTKSISTWMNNNEVINFLTSSSTRNEFTLHWVRK